MAVHEIMDYLENGNIKNSVNYPNCDAGACVDVGPCDHQSQEYSQYDQSVYENTR